MKPEAVVADSWYSSLDIPDEGLRVHLRGYGWIYVFRFVAKNGRTDYFGTNIPNPTRERIKSLVRKRWGIEVLHRELKQTCGLEYCQAHTSRAQRNHIVLSVLKLDQTSRITKEKTSILLPTTMGYN